MMNEENKYNYTPLSEPIPITEQVWPEDVLPLVCTRTMTYMHEKYIKDCIEGILIQKTTFPVRVTIHDDASTDRTTDIIRNYERNYPQLIIAYYQSKNTFSMKHKNPEEYNKLRNPFRALQIGKYNAVCEGDDYWTDPLKLQKQVEFLEANPDYVICYHNAIVIDENNKLISNSRLPDSKKRDYSQDELIKAEKIITGTKCYRNLIKDIPDEFNEAFGGDKFAISLLGAFGKGKYLSEIKPSAFRVHPGGVNSGDKDENRMFRNHFSTRLALYKYYKRINKKDYADYFLIEMKELIKKATEKGVILEDLIINNIDKSYSELFEADNIARKQQVHRQSNLVDKFYQGDNAEVYEDRRKKNPKWQFEDDVLDSVLNQYESEIKSIIDAPVGTGRFIKRYSLLDNSISIYGIDYSEDMIKEAAAKNGAERIVFLKEDLINNMLAETADLVICYRFLNLVPWQDAEKILDNLFNASNKYLLFAIRVVDDTYSGPTYIENKIHIHKFSDLDKIILKNRFQITRVFDFPDQKAGDYKIILCGRIQEQQISVRVNKNFKVVYDISLDGKKDKIYQVANNTHAEFIRSITNDAELSKYFPDINEVSEDFVSVQWVKGPLLKNERWLDVLSILLKIHSFKTDMPSGFDYAEDLIIPRFYLAVPIVGHDFYSSTVERIISGSTSFEKKLSHPDLIPGNVIDTGNGLKVIDNELICSSRHYFIDLLNMLFNLDDNMKKQVVQKISETNPGFSKEIDSNYEYLSALWLARQMGSYIVKEKLDSALRIYQDFNEGKNILPLSIQF